ncbi:phosphohydrolase [Chitinispirillum alkaliphilum]|nr:phosphohydrolase [Chitinispirillum alkaliphilum]
MERLEKQIRFLIEIDKVKNIIRRTRLISSKRYENDAEHGWHMGLMALILSEYSNEKIDICKVVKMALIHDIVEIDAGDTFLYAEDQSEKEEKEQACAKRVFGLLPQDQYEEFMSLWEEFEAKETAEAKFAGSLDRLGPVMQNYHDNGHAWRKHNITSDLVLNKNSQINKGSNRLWQYVKELIDNAVKRGFLKDKRENSN